MNLRGLRSSFAVRIYLFSPAPGLPPLTLCGGLVRPYVVDPSMPPNTCPVRRGPWGLKIAPSALGTKVGDQKISWDEPRALIGTFTSMFDARSPESGRSEPIAPAAFWPAASFHKWKATCRRSHPHRDLPCGVALTSLTYSSKPIYLSVALVLFFELDCPCYRIDRIYFFVEPYILHHLERPSSTSKQGR